MRVLLCEPQDLILKRRKLRKEKLMKLAQLRYFMEVYRLENLTQAANNLHISQPSVTVAIRELEQELGVSLFYRTKQRIYPTDAGHYFYNNLENIIGDLDHLVLDMKNMVSRRIIKLGVPPMMGTFLFPSIFQSFKSAYPEIDLDLVEDGVPMVQKLLLDDQLDFAFVLGSILNRADIEFIPIRKCRYVLCVHPSHPLSGQSVVSIRDIVNEPLALFNHGFFANMLVTQTFRDIGATPNTVLISSQIDTLKRFVVENLAATILLEDCVFDTDQISTIQVAEFAPTYAGIGWKKKRTFTKEVQKFIRFAETLACKDDL